jgi:hypothetical protein
LLSEDYNKKRKLPKSEQVDATTSNFKSKYKRFITEVQDIPPPGYYDNVRNIEKASYNIKYGYRQH